MLTYCLWRPVILWAQYDSSEEYDRRDGTPKTALRLPRRRDFPRMRERAHPASGGYSSHFLQKALMPALWLAARAVTWVVAGTRR